MKQVERRKIIVDKWLQNPSRPTSLIAKDLNMARTTVNDVLERYKEDLSIESKPGSGRKAGPSNEKLHKKIVQTIRKNRSMSTRDLAKKCGTSQSTIQKTKQREGMKSRKKRKVPRVSEKQDKTIKTRVRKLYDFLGTKNFHLILDDETYIKADFKTLPGPQYYIATAEENLPESETTTKHGKFDEKYLVYQAICECGERSHIFVTKDTINAEVYINECLKKRLLPFIRKHNVSTLFWPDLASAHYAKKTIQFLKDNKVDFVAKEMNPPNVPQCRPIENYWGRVKGQLRKTGQAAKNVQDFRRKFYNVAKKVTKESVKKDMAGIRKKLRGEKEKRRVPKALAT